MTRVSGHASEDQFSVLKSTQLEYTNNTTVASSIYEMRMSSTPLPTLYCD